MCRKCFYVICVLWLQEFFLSHNFTHAEFEVICWMTGWAVAGELNKGNDSIVVNKDAHATAIVPNEEPKNNNRMIADYQHIPHGERTQIGVACKVRLSSAAKTVCVHAIHFHDMLAMLMMMLLL